MKNLQKNNYKLILILLKYFPIVGALLLWIRVFLIAFFNIQNPIFELFVGTSILGGVILILANIVLEFCLMHKLFIYYDIFIGFCIDYQTIIGWGSWRTPMQYIVLILGILLFLYLIFSKSCLKSSEICFKN